MNNENKPINVLAITADNFALKEIRLRKPLESLKRQHLIDNFHVIEGFNAASIERLALNFDTVKYNVILLQRLAEKDFTDILNLMGLPYIFDIDDLLIAKPCYRKENLPTNPIKDAIKSAATVSVSTDILFHHLKSYLDFDFKNKTTIIPNGLPLPLQPKSASKPTGIILVQSDTIALTKSQNAVFSAVNDFCNKNKLPIYIISGKQNQFLANKFQRSKMLGLQSFHEHLDFLHYSPTMIGIAPLETDCDQITSDFINSKSDIKMVQFGGFGHAGVYSNAGPFLATDLCTGKIVENTYTAWSDALNSLLHRDTYFTKQEQASIIASRHIDVIVRDYWKDMLQQNTFFPGITVAELFSSVHKIITGRTGMRKLRYHAKKIIRYVYNFVR